LRIRSEPDKKWEKWIRHSGSTITMGAMSEQSFAELLGRIRQGDEQAAAEVVRLYEPIIRRAIRYRLSNAQMRHALDSMDICQSVLASFFIRAASGQYQLNQPEDLLKLLTAMARNKLKAHVRRQHAQRRDQRRVDAGADPHTVAGRDGTASQKLAARELLQEVHRRLSAEERQLVEWRQEGLEWEAIAARLGASPEALRKKLSRALERVAGELGVDEAGPA
jgi:RNA polymerase sigma-70 factor (ECF subfamily)